MGCRGFSCHRLADHDNKEGSWRNNSKWPVPVGRQQRSFSDNRRRGTTLRTFYRDNATTPLTLAEDLCDITVEDLKGITYEINHKGSVHLGLDATPQPD